MAQTPETSPFEGMDKKENLLRVAMASLAAAKEKVKDLKKQLAAMKGESAQRVSVQNQLDHFGQEEARLEFEIEQIRKLP